MTSNTADHRASPRNQIDCLIRLAPLETTDVAPEAAARPAAPAPRVDPGPRVDQPPRVDQAPATASSSGIVQDASASGARIWADRHYAPDERLIISFHCEKVGLDEPRSCRATVIWAEDDPVEGRWQIGIRFEQDDASATIASALTHGCPWCEKLCPDIAAPAPDGA